MSIDAALGRLGIQTGVCTSSTRPANPYEGQVIYETDTNNLRFWSGSAWESNKGAVISSAAPSSPAAGDIWYDSDDGRAYVYYDDGSSQQWVEFGAPPVQHGKILQVVSTAKTDTFSASTSNTFSDVTGLSATITPSSASSKIFVVAQVQGSTTSNGLGTAVLLRDSTQINLGDTAGSRVRASCSLDTNGATAEIRQAGLSYLDSPATTSAVTYKVAVNSGDTGGTVYINRAYDDADNIYQSRVSSTITVMEVSA